MLLKKTFLIALRALPKIEYSLIAKIFVFHTKGRQKLKKKKIQKHVICKVVFEPISYIFTSLILFSRIEKDLVTAPISKINFFTYECKH